MKLGPNGQSGLCPFCSGPLFPDTPHECPSVKGAGIMTIHVDQDAANIALPGSGEENNLRNGSCGQCGAMLGSYAEAHEHFPCSRSPVAGFIPDTCLWWADGAHAFDIIPQMTLSGANPLYAREKRCMCGATVGISKEAEVKAEEMRKRWGG